MKLDHFWMFQVAEFLFPVWMRVPHWFLSSDPERKTHPSTCPILLVRTSSLSSVVRLSGLLARMQRTTCYWCPILLSWGPKPESAAGRVWCTAVLTGMQICFILYYLTMGYGLDCRGSIPSRGKRFFSTPQRPDRIWDPHSLLFNGYQELFPEVRAAEAWSKPLSSEVKNGETSLLPSSLMLTYLTFLS
jgi:hypothetical protein